MFDNNPTTRSELRLLDRLEKCLNDRGHYLLTTAKGWRVSDSNPTCYRYPHIVGKGKTLDQLTFWVDGFLSGLRATCYTTAVEN